LILIPIGLFWATYRAWKEENDARLKAEEASPENLRRKVETLEANLARVTGRTPTPENHQRFFETVRRLGIEQFYPPVLCRVGDVEAMNFANQINDLYKELRNSELGIRYSFDAQGEFDYTGCGKRGRSTSLNRDLWPRRRIYQPRLDRTRYAFNLSSIALAFFRAAM
jgi:hypothetical protein